MRLERKPSSPEKIIIIYVVINLLWIIMSDPIIHILIKNDAQMLGMAIASNCLMVFFTAAFIYILMRRSWHALHKVEETLHNNYQTLEATHEELVAAEEQIHQQLDESKRQEEFYLSIYNGVADGVILQNSSGSILFANPAACNLLHTSLANMRHQKYISETINFTDELNNPFIWKAHAEKIISRDDQTHPVSFTLSRFYPDQRWLYLQSLILENISKGSIQVLTTVIDISMQKHNELKMILLHGITQRIMSEESLFDIYKYLCNELVNLAGFPGAFVGLKLPDGLIHFAAEAGMGEEYLKTVTIRWDDTPEGRGTVGEAIRSGKPQTSNLKENELFKHWWDFYDSLNLQSIATFPLKAHGQILGVFSVFSYIPNYFTLQHLNLLQTLAEQIALAILSRNDRNQLKLQNTALAAAANAIVLTDREGNIIWANQSFTNLTGYAIESVLSENLRFLRSGLQDSAFYKQMWDTIINGQTWHGELVNRRADGTHYHEEMTITPVYTEDKEITHFIAIKQDVTKRKQDEEALWLEKERAQITLASIGDAVITTNVQGAITYLNPVAEALTGWTNHQTEGLPLLKVFNIVNENTGQAVNNPVIQCIREKRIISLANHTLLIHRDGHAFAIEDSAAPIFDREGNVIGAVLVFHDVSDKRNLMRQLFYQAHHDALTGLPNRLLFNDRARQAIAQAHRRQDQAAILFLDLDRFKLINDTLGHNVGDQLLKTSAERISTCLRDGDTVARQGGDEFLILLPELNSESQAAYVAQKILDVFALPFKLHDQEVFVTASIGVALYPVDGEDVETLIKHADTAMYHTKDEGRNHYQFYTLALNKSLSQRLALQNDLRRALERQEFLLHFQPQYRLSDSQLCGVEALVRWQHPTRGLLQPGEFIPIAEDSGLILALGEWVIREACVKNKQWQEKGYPRMRVAVNLSARQFRQTNLVNRIKHILDETGLDARWLELEITESISMENFNLSLTILHELKKMGIRISMDDFGTGFSSLSYLSQFPLDTLKIDRSFVSSLPSRQEGKVIVTTIIQLAQNLGIRVIAEGVETEEQLEFLRKKQCDEVQGFLFAKPVPEEALLTYFYSSM